MSTRLEDEPALVPLCVYLCTLGSSPFQEASSSSNLVSHTHSVLYAFDQYTRVTRLPEFFGEFSQRIRADQQQDMSRSWVCASDQTLLPPVLPPQFMCHHQSIWISSTGKRVTPLSEIHQSLTFLGRLHRWSLGRWSARCCLPQERVLYLRELHLFGSTTERLNEDGIAFSVSSTFRERKDFG